MSPVVDLWRDKMDEKLDRLLEVISEIRPMIAEMRTFPTRLTQLEGIVAAQGTGQRESRVWEVETEKRTRTLEKNLIEDGEKRMRLLEDWKNGQGSSMNTISKICIGLVGLCGFVVTCTELYRLFH